MEVASLVISIIALLTSVAGAVVAWRAHRAGGALVQLSCSPVFTQGHETRLRFVARNSGRSATQLQDLVLRFDPTAHHVLPPYLLTGPADLTLAGGSAATWEGDLGSLLAWWKSIARDKSVPLAGHTAFDVRLQLGSGELVRQSHPPTSAELEEYAAGQHPGVGS